MNHLSETRSIADHYVDTEVQYLLLVYMPSSNTFTDCISLSVDVRGWFVRNQGFLTNYTQNYPFVYRNRAQEVQGLSTNVTRYFRVRRPNAQSLSFKSLIIILLQYFLHSVRLER